VNREPTDDMARRGRPVSRSKGAIRDSTARVLLVEAHKLFRDALALAINQAGEFHVSADVGTAQEAIESCRRDCPDIVVMGIELEIMSGIEATREILKTRPETRVILLQSSRDENPVLRAIHSGAVGLVFTSSPASHLVEALQAVAQGRSYLEPSGWDVVVDRVRQTRGESRSGLQRLSEQDRQLLALIIQGKTTKEIASIAGVTDGVLRNLRKELMRKMGVKSTVELITSALGKGFQH